MSDAETREAITKAAASAIRKNCGDCRLWMTRACPREHLVTHGYRAGFSDGPSAGCWACDKFTAK